MITHTLPLNLPCGRLNHCSQFLNFEGVITLTLKIENLKQREEMCTKSKPQPKWEKFKS